MSSAHSMNARKCVHAQKPYPSQAFAHESSKGGGRGKREARKTEARRLMERKAKQNASEELKQGVHRHRKTRRAKAQQNKACKGTAKQGVQRHSKTRRAKAQLRLIKQGVEGLTFCSHIMWPPAPQEKKIYIWKENVLWKTGAEKVK